MLKAEYLQHTYVTILCGGSGTRVWPLSIKKKPKQFVNFYSDKTLYQETLARAKQIVPAERIMIITNAVYKSEIRKQSPEIPQENIFAEPQKKNTALAVGVAAAMIKKRDPLGIMISMHSDHVITQIDLFCETLRIAAQVAFKQNNLVAIGIQPTHPHTGLGYIHIGEKKQEVATMPVFKVTGFREKPDLETAKQFLDTGEYLWNGGYYIWSVKSILDAFAKLDPKQFKTITAIALALGTSQQEKIIAEQYRLADDEAIDTAISEKADNLYVIPGKFSWYDVGSWQVVYELGEKDEKGNVIVSSSEAKSKAPIVLEQADKNLIYSNNQPIAVVGLSNIAVVDTGNGLLICDKNKSNDVKKVVESLHAQNLDNFI